jgi:hypothetical protein
MEKKEQTAQSEPGRSLTPCQNPGRPGKRKTCFFPSKTPPDENSEFCSSIGQIFPFIR